VKKHPAGQTGNDKREDARTTEKLFRLYYNPLCNYCMGIVDDREVAEDIVQDVFAYLWDHRHAIDMNAPVKTYLYTATRNGALKYLRQKAMKQAHSPHLAEFITYLQQLDDPENEHRVIEKIRHALDDLPPRARQIFLMNCLEEKTYKEIADALGISVNTVKTQLARAHAAIKARVDTRDLFLLLLLTRWPLASHTSSLA
jgi:RNA polymerase sigma-70 factor (ECF subfamily)